jgi:tRNA nucleotidyltransferase (CCA-adding enzyme)
MAPRQAAEAYTGQTMQTDKTAGWSLFHHDADIGVRGRGPSLEVAFEQAALALTAVMTDPQSVHPETAISVHCEAPDIELLLVDWLNALVFETATRKMLFSRFEVAIHARQLDANAWGEAIDTRRHQPAAEIKGATYTELSVRQDRAGQWVAQCVVDV